MGGTTPKTGTEEKKGSSSLRQGALGGGPLVSRRTRLSIFLTEKRESQKSEGKLRMSIGN